MGETVQAEHVVESASDPIQFSQASMSGVVPPQPEPTEDHVGLSKNIRTPGRDELDGNVPKDDTENIQGTARTTENPNAVPSKDIPENQTERVETTMETEYEAIEGGTKKHVKSSVMETKEFSHRVHRTLFNDSPDSTSANVSEFSEAPRARPRIPVKTNIDFGQKLPRTPVIPTTRVSSARPVFIERTIDTSRAAAEQRSRTMPVGSFVPIQLHEEVKRSYERELAELKNVQSSPSTKEMKTDSKEEMTRHILQLETDLRDSKNMSDVLSDEIKTSRKRFEYMLNKTVQMENMVRSLQEKLKDYKTKNKQLLRDTHERDTLIEKLRDAHSHVKRMERYVEKMEDERSMLVKDYEILRQSHNRKEQQLQGYTTERAELLRRLDILEYDKQQLEFQLMDYRRKDRSSTYRSGTTSSLPYGELPVDLQVDVNPPPERATPAASAAKTNGMANTEEQREPGWEIGLGEPTPTLLGRTETGDEETLRECLAGAENIVSPSGNVDTLAADPSTRVADELSPADTAQDQSSPQRIQTEGQDENQAGQACGSPEASPELLGEHRHHSRPQRLSLERDERILSLTDSQDEELGAPYIHSSARIAQSYDDTRYMSSKNYHVKRRNIRRPGDYHTSRSVDIRGDSYTRNSRYRRPTSAYGYVSSRYTTRDIDVFPSPLPPRSTTSLGRSAFIEHIRSPDREFSRMHRSPIRRPNAPYAAYTTLSPDPFRYEPVRSSRAELGHLESQLDSLKREKRRLERQYNATQTASTLTDNLRRREELVRMSRTCRHHSEMTHYS
ncbi:hypothetical protein D915_003331 [Fasciola hepatica]|uniref:Uncharacterized protein n=1 Tax=Fasciola hepatica TaxID=6192 RepID=A0A4E0S2E5_FASHE|nr:hypothetical protein D915_003331 [Fasciola hepatica]